MHLYIQLSGIVFFAAFLHDFCHYEKLKNIIHKKINTNNVLYKNKLHSYNKNMQLRFPTEYSSCKANNFKSLRPTFNISNYQ